MSNYQSLSDETLFSLLCNDDHGAYTEIYNRYSGVLYVHAFRRIRNREEAKDLIHELFTAMWVKREQIMLNTALSSYLYQSVRNRVIDRVSRQKRELIYMGSITGSGEETGATDFAVRQKDLHQLIEKEIDALPEKMKVIFRMSRNAYMSHKEISNELSISEHTVRKQINNALKVLKPKLSKYLDLFILLSFWFH
jgi:RNA polymerase sigma-70 factor (family 1)